MSDGRAARRAAQKSTSARIRASSAPGSNASLCGAADGGGGDRGSAGGGAMGATGAAPSSAAGGLASSGSSIPTDSPGGARPGPGCRRRRPGRPRGRGGARGWSGGTAGRSSGRASGAGLGSREGTGGAAQGGRRPRRASVRRGQVREGAGERLVVRAHAVAGRDHEVGEQGELRVDDVVTELAAVEGQGPERGARGERGRAAERERELVGQQDGRDRRDLARRVRRRACSWSARCRSR